MSDYDVVGVGLGPFNLGLAALLEPVDELTAAFFEARPRFSWHPGLMLPGTRLQVPFLADLVTLADPTNRYSFLNYLHERGRLYRFYFHERFHMARREYEAYARWVVEQLASCQLGQAVQQVCPSGDGGWLVTLAPSAPPAGKGELETGGVGRPARRFRDRDAQQVEVKARAVVLGVGTEPYVPQVARPALGDDVFHAAEFLTYRAKVAVAEAVTVVGSGQSAGEVVADLLESSPLGRQQLDWFTRSAGFFPMEYSKLGLEHFTPEYTSYFHGLPQLVRDQARAGQDLLYKGLSAETSARIYDRLYEATIDGDEVPVTYAAGCELVGVEPSPQPGRRWRLTWRHVHQDRTFVRDTDMVVLATGYRPAPLPVPDGVLATDGAGRPVVDADYRVQLADGSASTLFVQNAELHTHGVGAPDLGLGAYRSSVIINALAGREVYPGQSRTVFQQFGAPA